MSSNLTLSAEFEQNRGFAVLFLSLKMLTGRQLQVNFKSNVDPNGTLAPNIRVSGRIEQEASPPDWSLVSPYVQRRYVSMFSVMAHTIAGQCAWSRKAWRVMRLTERVPRRRSGWSVVNT